MTWYNIIGWLATIGVLLCYAVRIKWFDWANVVLCIPVALPALILGAYNGAFISLTFGAIGLFHIVRNRHGVDKPWIYKEKRT